jgi:hypothetical protein
MRGSIHRFTRERRTAPLYTYSKGASGPSLRFARLQVQAHRAKMDFRAEENC